MAGPALAANTGCEVMAVLSSPHAHSASGYSMPFRSIWLAAMSMTLMMKAMAKAQIRLFLTHVCRFFFFGWTEGETERKTWNAFVRTSQYVLSQRLLDEKSDNTVVSAASRLKREPRDSELGLKLKQHIQIQIIRRIVFAQERFKCICFIYKKIKKLPNFCSH